MNSGTERSIMTNPISELLDKNSLESENIFPSDDSSSMNWTLVILGFIIFVFVVFMAYKQYTGGENIFEKMYDKIKEIFESIKNRFHSSKSSTANIEQHMEDDHGVHTKDQNPATVSSIPHATLPQSQHETNKDDLNNAINHATPNYTPEPGYGADDSYSSIQKSKSSSKSGWCYIGEDRGFRSCIDVSEKDKCMSGDIFPTSEICVNPNLRI